jgi:autotransporter-associated beta strand protein
MIGAGGTVAAYSNYEASANTLIWSPRSNIRVAAPSLNIPGDTTINTIATAGTQDIATGGELIVNGILADGDVTISGSGSLTSRYWQMSTHAHKSTSTLSMNVPLRDGPGGGRGGGALDLVHTGPGTLALNADNTLTGTIYVNSGTLELGELGQIRQATVQTTGTFNPSHWQKTIGGLAGSGSVITEAGGVLSIGANNRSTTFSGVISGDGAISKIGDGTLALTGDNTYTGLTTIAAGTLNLQRLGGDILIHGDAELRVGDGSTLVGSKDIVVVVPGTSYRIGGGTHPQEPAVINVADNTILRMGNVGINEQLPDTKLHKSGAGTLELGAENQSSGGVVVSGGTLELCYEEGKSVREITDKIEKAARILLNNTLGNNSDRLNDNGFLEMAGGMLESIDNPATPVTETIGQVALTDAGNRFQGKYLIQSVHHRTSGATANFSPDASGDITFASPPALVHDLIGPWATFTDPTSGQTDYATIQSAPGGGRVWPQQGYWTAAESTWDSTENVSVDSDTVLTAAREVNTIKIKSPPSGGSASVSPANGETFRTNAILASGDVRFEPTGDITATNVQDLIVHVPTTSDTVTIASNITDNSGGPVDLVVSGDGTVVLSGNNTYTGATKVSKSVLKTFFQSGDKPTQSQFRMSDGTWDTSAHDQTIGALSGSGKVILGGSTAIIGSNGLSSRFEGSFESSTGGGIKKIGAGTLEFDGAFNNNGQLHVEAGNMRLRIDQLETRLQALGLLSDVRLGGSTTSGGLEFDGTGDVQIPVPIAVDFGGGTIAAGGSVSMSGGISGGGTLVFKQLAKQQKYAEFRLLAPDAHTGETIVDGALLSMESGGALLGTSAVTIQNGATLKADKVSGASAGNFAINPAAPITLDGGALQLANFSGSPLIENRGILGLKEYNNTLQYLAGDTAIHDTVIFQALERTGGGTIKFQGADNDTIRFTSPPALSNGIIGPWAYVEGTNYATINGVGAVAALETYNSNPDPASWAAGDNVDLSGDVTIAQDTTINTLRRAPAAVPRAAALQHAVLRTDGILAGGIDDSINGTGSITAKNVGLYVSVVNGQSAASKLTINVPIDDNNNPVSLVKSGDGTLVLNATPAHTGSTVVGAGTLKFGIGVDLPDSTLDIAAGATVEFEGSSRLFLVKGEGNIGLGSVEPSQRLKVGSGGGSSTFGGQISGAGGITKVGAGALTLTGVSDFTGEFEIDDGSVVLSDDGAIPNASAYRIKRDLIIDRERKGDRLLNRTAPITLDGGSLTVLDSSIDSDPLMLDVVQLNHHGSSTSSNQRLVFSALDRTPRSTLHLQTAGTGEIGFVSPPAMINGIIGPWATITNAAGETDWGTIGDWAIFDGTMWKKIDNSESYVTSNDAATWQPTDNVKPTNEVIELTSPASVNTIKLENQKHLHVDNTIASARGILTTGSGDQLIDGGALSAPAGTNELIVHAHGTGGTFRIDSSITDNGAPVALVKSGPQTLTLGGANSYSGATAINEGTLEITSAASVGNSTQLTLSNAKLRSISGGGILIPQVDVTTSGKSTIDTSAGSITVGDIDGDGDLTKDGDGTLAVNSINARKFGIAKGVAQVGLGVAPAIIPSRLTQLTIAPTAQLDLRQRRPLVLVSGSVGDASGIALLASGYNGGTWDGPGVMSSDAVADVTGLAAASAADLGITTFAGLDVSPSDLCIVLTYAGDANLSGSVDADDYWQIDANYNKPSSTARYFTGDFDYNGVIDGDDYHLIDSGFAGQSGGGAGGALPMGGVSAVPEPAGLGLLAIGSALLMRRRRRR